jgi:Protein of unknown function (DUF3126)
VRVSDEFLGVLHHDEDDGEVSWALHMTILEEDLPSAPGGAAAALTTLVPRLPAFAADLAQHATDGGHDLIR